MSYKDFDHSDWPIERIAKYDVQLATRGFDDSDWWGLDMTIAKFTLPRLQAFKEGAMSFPSSMTSEEWNEILAKMITSFEIILDSERWPAPSKEDAQLVQEGCEMFGKHFTNLWS